MIIAKLRKPIRSVPTKPIPLLVSRIGNA